MNLYPVEEKPAWNDVHIQSINNEKAYWMYITSTTKWHVNKFSASLTSILGKQVIEKTGSFGLTVLVGSDCD